MKNRLSFKRKHLSIPYILFTTAFVILPLLLIVYYAFTDKDGSFSFENIVYFFTSGGNNIGVLLISILIGAANTILCLIIGYPIAYFLANKKYNKSYVVVLLFIMPMWINFVLRTSATRELLRWIGLDGGIYPYTATIIGMVYNYLPFVILPLYSTMLKIDKPQLEASHDLGGNSFVTFFKVLLPMTAPGIASAATMVFMPTMSSYVISDIMGERNITLIGNYINTSFELGQWNMGSFYALIMLLLIALSNYLIKDVKEDSDRGTLW